MKIVNSNEFVEVTKEGLVLVDFFANWCGPCRMMSPVLEEVEEEIEGLTVVKVDTDENGSLAAKYGVQSIPNMILFKDGKPVDQIIGFRPKEDVIETIEKYV
ncbi:MAG: thioredoxin [Bacilli bacterium]|nr:thioredoxin [Bacilli bacterium]